VLARASAEPRTFAIGIDANAAAMVEASRRANRGRDRTRLTNACFLVEAAEALPGPLAHVASLVTVTLPWGSLLRGVLGRDPSVLGGLAALVAPTGRVEALVSVIPTDHVDGLPFLDGVAEAGIADAWRSVGFELGAMRPATRDDLRAMASSWARRLGDRPAWHLEFRRGSAPLVAPTPTSHTTPRWATLGPDRFDPSAPPRVGRQRRTCERGQGDDAPAR
jgi:16S rRNA (adenine(1408)-N(1))-methyltransferase